VEFWKSGKRKKKFATVQHIFKKIKHKSQLYRWAEQVSEGGSRLEKLKQISSYVLENFEDALKHALPIHDCDLRKWALNARDQVGLSDKIFKASPKYVHDFKKKHRIVSRKINKFITQSTLTSKEQLVQKADHFVSQVKSEMSSVNQSNTYNSDQSGFCLEMHAGRTLSYIGTLKVESLAQSINSLTHSYTIQPFVSAEGLLKSPLLIVMQEKNGQFGPIVEKNLFRARNITVYASTSGKLTSDLAIKWFKEVFLPNVGENSILCVDSWSGQGETKFQTVENSQKKVKVMTIPSGTTGMIQPLDVYGFRPWKNFVKYFSDLVMLHKSDINLHARNNILKLQSLVHNQFSSPRFIYMFKYAWYKSGYITEAPPKCETPVRYCFNNYNMSCQKCDELAIMRCGWCTKSICMNHFFGLDTDDTLHYCNDYHK